MKDNLVEGCRYCDITLKSLKEEVIFEDEFAIGIHLKDLASSIGHLRIMPKNHISNIEDLDIEQYTRLFTMASLAATLAFENCYEGKEKGTTIILKTGNDGGSESGHAYFDCMLRMSEDGINTKWQNKEPDFSFVNKLKDITFIMQENLKQKDNVVIEEKPVEKKKEEKQKENNNIEETKKEESNKETEIDNRTPTEKYKDRIKTNIKMGYIQRSP